jgi:hypothetical protein
MAKIQLLSSLETASQIPLDAKLVVKTVEELEDLGSNNFKAAKYHEDMVIRCLENHTSYIWREEKTLNEPSGLLNTSYTYPTGSITIEPPVDYSGRNFNFFVDTKTIFEVEGLNAAISSVTNGVGSAYETRALAVSDLANDTSLNYKAFLIYNETGFNGQYRFDDSNVNDYVLINPYRNIATVISENNIDLVNSGQLFTERAERIESVNQKINTSDVEDADFAINTANWKAVLGVDNINNTSDANKPISTPQQSALDLRLLTSDLEDADFNINTLAWRSVLKTNKSISTINNLRLETTPINGNVVILLGYYAAGDKPLVSYKWDSASTATDNGGNIIKITAITTGRWIGTFSDANVKDFGAKGDYNRSLNTGTDDYLAFQNAINSKENRASNVIVPRGDYKIGSTLELGQSTSITGIQTLFPVQETSGADLIYVSQTALHFTNNTNGFTTQTALSVAYRSQGIQLRYLGIFGGGEAQGKTGLSLVENTNSTATFNKIGLPTVESCYFWDWDTITNASGTDSFNFLKNHLSNCRVGLNGGLSENVITNNIFYKISETAVITNGSNYLVSDNEFEPTTTTGVSLLIANGTKDIRVVDNHFKKNKFSINITATTGQVNGIISNNSFVEAYGDKYIFISGSNNIKITNNIFNSTSLNTVAGNFIRVSASKNISINDNLFSKTSTGLITKPVYIENSVNFQLLNNENDGFTNAQFIPTIINSSERPFTTFQGNAKKWNDVSNGFDSKYIFDGVNGRVNFTTPSNLFSFNGSCRVRFKTSSDITTQQFIIGGAVPRFYVRIASGQVNLILGDNTANVIVPTVEANTEYDLLFTWTDDDNNGAGIINAYLNNRVVGGSFAYTGFTSMPANFSLASNNVQDYFTGEISRFMIFKSVLTESQRNFVFNYPETKFDASFNCVSKLTFAKKATQWVDVSGSGNNGNIVGSAIPFNSDIISFILGI